jgi:hypothetical protein
MTGIWLFGSRDDGGDRPRYVLGKAYSRDTAREEVFMKKSVAVAFIGVFYAPVVLMGVALLAFVQLRSSGGATFDTWRLNYDANRVLNASLRENVRKAEEKARSDANSVSANKVCMRLYDNGVPRLQLVDKQTLDQVTKAKQANTSSENLFGDVYCLVRGYSTLENDIGYFQRLVEDDNAEVADFKKSLDSNEQQYAELIKGHQDFLAYREMEKTWYTRPFVAAPYDLLVMLLVMFMGALGGIVRLLRDYGAANHPNPTAEEYLLIPLIGAVVAIGGYVLAKAGLLLLSSTQGESSLSPFMISLVGIVSGLLAKEVIDSIAARGRGIIADRNRPTTPPE